MELITLTAKPREPKGTRLARRTRRQGLVPGILYGHGMKPVALEVGARELHHALHTKAGANVVIELNLEGARLKEKTCRVKDLQHNPVTDAVTHVDFSVISLTERIQVKVPLVVAHPEEIEGIKQGGILDVIHHEIDVECLPTAIPERIELNLKSMKIGDAVHSRELKLPEGVACLMEPEEVVVAMHAPKMEEEEPAEEEVQQPEVIEKGKKEEPEAEGKEAPAPKKEASKEEAKPAK